MHRTMIAALMMAVLCGCSATTRTQTAPTGKFAPTTASPLLMGTGY